LSFHLLPQDIKSKTQRTIILPFVLHGCGNWSLASRGRTQTESAEEDIWGKEGRGNRRVEKTTQ